MQNSVEKEGNVYSLISKTDLVVVKSVFNMDLDVMFERIGMFEILSSEDVEEVGVQMNFLALFSSFK